MTVTFFSTKDGSTALHHAASKGNTEMFNLLIDNDIDINLQDKAGNTVLHVAANQDPQMVKYLINNNCDPNIPNAERCVFLNIINNSEKRAPDDRRGLKLENVKIPVFPVVKFERLSKDDFDLVTKPVNIKHSAEIPMHSTSGRLLRPKQAAKTEVEKCAENENKTGSEKYTNRTVTISKNTEMWNEVFREHQNVSHIVMASLNGTCQWKRSGDLLGESAQNVQNAHTDLKCLTCTKRLQV
ncbi:unnamed protein product [Mytilus coruscus]|uniref:Uncharacterized protein n=1 Tax=Mytilus coruscus TaxID=42192 RepID=A0A6J8AUG9_MYTCO|nr:unnamed protein product [Mytilus coruscus]